MELKLLLRLLLKKWWIVLAAVFITVGSTVGFTLMQTPIYSTSTIYVVSPSLDLLEGSNFVGGLSVLGGQPTITNTYATIVTSDAIRQSAIRELGLNTIQASNLSVVSRVKSGTNLIEITVEGSDPLIVQAFANRVGQSTEEYVNTLYEVYNMKVLDSARAPESPIWPNMTLNVIVALILGVVLGGGLVILTSLNEY
jgi:polysaccharide biosynthesis transport protein